MDRSFSFPHQNHACILVAPTYATSAYHHMLIDFMALKYFSRSTIYEGIRNAAVYLLPLRRRYIAQHRRESFGKNKSLSTAGN